MKFKKVMRRDNIQGHFRLFRILWSKGVVGDGKGYSAKFSLALTKKFFKYERLSIYDIELTLLGLRFHYKRAYGGIIV